MIHRMFSLTCHLFVCIINKETSYKLCQDWTLHNYILKGKSPHAFPQQRASSQLQQVKAFIFMPVAPVSSYDNVQNNNMQIGKRGAGERHLYNKNIFLLHWTHTNKKIAV